MKEQKWNNKADRGSVREIVNVSMRQLSASSRGDCLNISKVQADEIRWKTREALEKAKPKSNITRNERLAKKTLRSETNIIILPAEKSNVSMVVGQLEYSNKLASLVGNGIYSKGKIGSDLKTERRL